MAFGSDAPGRGVPEIEMAHFGAGGDPALANVPATLIARSGDWQLRKNTLAGFLVSVNARTWDRWCIGQASGDRDKDIERWREYMAKSVGIKI
jgi:hypothetical protein